MKKLLIAAFAAQASMLVLNPVGAATAMLCTFCMGFVECIDEGLQAGEYDMLYQANKCREILCRDNPVLDPIAVTLIDQELDNIIGQLELNTRYADICGKRNLKLCDGTCAPCTNCTSDETWMPSIPGYEGKMERACNCGVCESEPVWQCAAGYYGTTTDGTTGCTRCPSSGGVYGKSASGSTDITSCYLPSGTSGSDSTGSFTYTGNCYYVN